MVFTTKPLLPSLLLAPIGHLLSILAVALSLGTSAWAMAGSTTSIRLVVSRLGACVEIRGQRAQPSAG